MSARYHWFGPEASDAESGTGYAFDYHQPTALDVTPQLFPPAATDDSYIATLDDLQAQLAALYADWDQDGTWDPDEYQQTYDSSVELLLADVAGPGAPDEVLAAVDTSSYSDQWFWEPEGARDPGAGINQHVPALAPEVFYANTAEGGSDGTTVTTGNSGGASGQAWDVVTVPTGTSFLHFDDGQPVQTLGYRSHVDAGGTSITELRWNFSTPQQRLAFRVYAWFSRFDPGGTAYRVVSLYNPIAPGNPTGLSVDAGGILAITDTGGSAFGFSTPIPPETMVRIEGLWERGSTPSTGHAEAKLFLDPNSTTPDETKTLTGSFGDGAFDNIRFGKLNSGFTSPELDWYLDEIAVDTAGYIGRSANTAPTGARPSLVANQPTGSEHVAAQFDWSWDPAEFQQFPSDHYVAALFPPPLASTDEELQAAAQTFENLEAFPAPSALEDYSSITNDDAAPLILADRQITDADALAVSLGEAESLQAFEAIAQLIASQPSFTEHEYGALTPREALTEPWNQSAEDITHVFADRQVADADSVDVALAEAESVQAFESIEGLTAAQNWTLDSPQVEESYQDPSTVLDVSGFLSLGTVQDDSYIATIDGAAEVIFEPAISFVELANESTLDVSFLTAGFVFVDSDAVAVAIGEAESLTSFEGIEGLVAAQQPADTRPIEEALTPSVELANETALEVAWLTGAFVIPSLDSIDVGIGESESVQAFESIEGLVAAQPTDVVRITEDAPQATTETANETVLDVSYVFADRQLADVESVDVAIGEAEAVQAFESIDALSAAQLALADPSATPAGPVADVELANETTLDVGWFFADVIAAGLAEQVAANYSTFEYALELLDPDARPSLGIEHQNLTTLDTTFALTAFVRSDADSVDVSLGEAESLTIQQGITELIAADAPEGAGIGSVEAQEAPGTSIEDRNQTALDTSWIVAQNAQVTDAENLDVSLTETESLQAFQAPEQVIASEPFYGRSPGSEDALFAASKSYEDSDQTSLDVSWLFAQANISDVDSLDVSLAESETVQAFQRIVELIAADPAYSSAIGAVEALFPPVKSYEDFDQTTMFVNLIAQQAMDLTYGAGRAKWLMGEAELKWLMGTGGGKWATGDPELKWSTGEARELIEAGDGST